MARQRRYCTDHQDKPTTRTGRPCCRRRACHPSPTRRCGPGRSSRRNGRQDPRLAGLASRERAGRAGCTCATGVTPLDADSSGLGIVHQVEAFSPTRHIRRDGIVVHRWQVADHYILDEPCALAVPEMSVLLLAIRGEWEWVCAALEHGLVTPWSCRMARGAMSWRFRQHEIDAALGSISLEPWSVSEFQLAQTLRDGVNPGCATARTLLTAAAA